MFKEQTLEFDAIANWFTQPELNLLEPINVIWIDYSAANAQEAYKNVSVFLLKKNFKSETGSVEVPPGSGAYFPKHTTGYFGYYDNLWPNESNHGRIFPSYNAGIDNPVYYTLGSFSREGTAINNPPHPFMSFERAQLALIRDPIPEEWEYEKIDVNWGNVISTDDHSGVAIIVRIINEPQNASFEVSPISGVVSSPFMFDAKTSTDDHDSFEQLEFGWDWENDGNWDTDYSSYATPVFHQYQTSGKKTVKLEVRDTGGLSDIAVKNVFVTDTENTNDPLLIGTWDLTSVNGQPIPPGVYLRWTFTENTVTVTFSTLIV